MRTSKILFVLLMLMTTGLQAQTKDWIVLFDGKSTSMLRGYKMDSFPASCWRIQDHALVSKTGVPNIDFVTKESFKNFELELSGRRQRPGTAGSFSMFRKSPGTNPEMATARTG